MKTEINKTITKKEEMLKLSYDLYSIVLNNHIIKTEQESGETPEFDFTNEEMSHLGLIRVLKLCAKDKSEEYIDGMYLAVLDDKTYQSVLIHELKKILMDLKEKPELKEVFKKMKYESRKQD